MQEIINKKAGTSTKESSDTTTAQKDANCVADMNKNEADEAKEKTEEEVKESFKDEDVPVEPAVGNDGLEVGGEG